MPMNQRAAARQGERLRPNDGWMHRAIASLLGVPSSATSDTKASANASVISIENLGAPVWAPRDYASFAREGMMQNPIAYRAVRMVSEAAASVPLLLYNGDIEIETHPLLDLLRRPAPGQTHVDLLESWYGFLLVAGNAYLEAVAVDGRVRELHALRSDRMTVVPGADGWPEAFNYSVGGRTVRIGGDAVPGVARVLHTRLFHPLNDHYGLSPIEAAATAIDIHNEASRWNKALLDNSARPSGALVYTATEHMTPTQFERLKRELEESFQGARNAGRPLLLEGGLDWRAMSLSPRDMDFIALKQMAAREIALALGIPPMLLGIPGDNAYANYQEANRAFWRQTVIPLVKRLAAGLSGWLGSAGGLRFVPDIDGIDALSVDREALWARLQATSFLSDDEKRAAVGYGPQANADAGAVAQKFNPHHDAAGRFTSGPGGGGVTPVAGRPRGPVGPPKPPPAGVPATPPSPRSDYGATPRGKPFTEHGRKQAAERNFTDERIDAIVENNTKSRVGKVDQLGAKTWEYSDSRGNTVVTNEKGGIITVYSRAPGGAYADKP